MKGILIRFFALIGFCFFLRDLYEVPALEGNGIDSRECPFDLPKMTPQIQVREIKFPRKYSLKYGHVVQTGKTKS